MANKFEGNWHYKFLSINASGEVVVDDQGHFHLPKVENTGDLTNATDDDGGPLTGDIKKNGNVEIIHLNRAQGPERHLRGFLAVDGATMVLVGVHRRQPFPNNIQPDARKADASLFVQTDGTWVATKP